MSERRPHQCHKPGCDSEARHEVHLRLWFDGLRNPLPLDMLSTVKVCDRHRPWAAQWLISPSNRAAIAIGLLQQGLGWPDFGSAQVGFSDIEPAAIRVVTPLHAMM